MVIKGNGGEGKTQIGTTLESIFGTNMKDGSIGKISENRFARADLEHILLCVDDDMKMEALKQTNYIKPVLKKSYSVLQDDFFNAMRSAGYTDLERGERGSSEEHLTVTQFKVEREQERLEGLTEQNAQKAQEAAALGKKIERYQKQQVAIQKVDAIEAKPVPLSSTKVILERKEYEALKATAKKYIAQEKREGVLQKALDAAKGLINELKAEIASLREELSYYRSPKFQMKLHRIEKENFDLRDKLRVYNLIIDRHDLGRFFGKNRDMGRSRDEVR